MIIISFDKARDLIEQINELTAYYRERGIYVFYMSHDDNNFTFKVIHG